MPGSSARRDYSDRRMPTTTREVSVGLRNASLSCFECATKILGGRGTNESLNSRNDHTVCSGVHETGGLQDPFIFRRQMLCPRSLCDCAGKAVHDRKLKIILTS